MNQTATQISSNLTGYTGINQIVHPEFLVGIILLGFLTAILLFLYQPVYNFLRSRAKWLVKTFELFVWGIGGIAAIAAPLTLIYYLFAEPASRGETGNFWLILYALVAYFVIAGIGWLTKKVYSIAQSREKQFKKTEAPQ